MVPNGILGAGQRRRLFNAIMLAGAVAAVAWLLVGPIKTAEAAAPVIGIEADGNKLQAAVTNGVDVKEDSWEWFRYTEVPPGQGFDGCGGDYFNLEGSDLAKALSKAKTALGDGAYKTGQGSSVMLEAEDDGYHYCFTVESTDDKANSKKHKVSYVAPADESSGSATNSDAGASGSGTAGSNADAGSKQAGAVPDLGTEEDVLLGSLFILGLAASIACGKIWLDAYKRRRTEA